MQQADYRQVLPAAEEPLKQAYPDRSVLVQKGSVRNEGNFSAVGSTASVRCFLFRSVEEHLDL